MSRQTAAEPQRYIDGGDHIGVIGGWLFPEPWRNINWVHEFVGMKHVWMPDPLWIAVLVIAYPLAIFLPDQFLQMAETERFNRKLELVIASMMD